MVFLTHQARPILVVITYDVSVLKSVCASICVHLFTLKTLQQTNDGALWVTLNTLTSTRRENNDHLKSGHYFHAQWSPVRPLVLKKHKHSTTESLYNTIRDLVGHYSS